MGGAGMGENSVRGIADDAWAWLVATQPSCAVRAGVTPDAIPSASEQQVHDNARHAAALLERLRAAERLPGDEDLAAILEHLLVSEVAKADHLWLEHVAATYSLHALGLTPVVDMVIAPLPSDTAEQMARREALTRTRSRSWSNPLHRGCRAATVSSSRTQRNAPWMPLNTRWMTFSKV